MKVLLGLMCKQVVLPSQCRLQNYYLSPERTLKRKLTEIFLARKIEQNLSKDILSLYVNKIFLGKNAYGIAAAAKFTITRVLMSSALLKWL